MVGCGANTLVEASGSRYVFFSENVHFTVSSSNFHLTVPFMIATVFPDIPMTLFLTGFSLSMKSVAVVVMHADVPLSTNKAKESEKNKVSHTLLG